MDFIQRLFVGLIEFVSFRLTGHVDLPTAFLKLFEDENRFDKFVQAQIMEFDKIIFWYVYWYF